MCSQQDMLYLQPNPKLVRAIAPDNSLELSVHVLEQSVLLHRIKWPAIPYPG